MVTDSSGEQSLAVTVIRVLASCLSGGPETYTTLEYGEKEQLLIPRASPEADLPSLLEGAAATHSSKWKPRNMACSSCSSVEHLFISVLSYMLLPPRKPLVFPGSGIEASILNTSLKLEL